MNGCHSQGPDKTSTHAIGVSNETARSSRDEERRDKAINGDFTCARRSAGGKWELGP